MQALIQDFSRFIAGQISGDEFRSACEGFVKANPDQRAGAAAWFEEGVRSGRVSAACWESIADAFKSAPPASADGSLYAVGTVIKGRYRLIEEISRGPACQVFKAQDEDLQRARSAERFIALEVFTAPGGAGTAAGAAMQREFNGAKSLTHDQIARLYDLDWDGTVTILTREYLEGSPLSALLRTDYARGGELSMVWPIIAAAGGALAFAHEKGVIHSRLGPGSVLLLRGNSVKLLDFVGPPRPGGVATPYASLEQCAGKAATAQDDVYAFAVMVYEMLSGHHPFANVSALAAFEAGLVPKRLDGLRRGSWEALRSALAFRREARTQSIRQLLASLEPVSRVRKYRLLLGGGALIAITAGIAVGSRYYADYLERETLRAAVRAPAGAPVARPKITPERRKEIEDSLFLAEDYLRDVNTTQPPDELAYALSEGANNINQILDSVLAADPGNSRALQLKARVAELYLNKARELSAQHELSAALAITQFGLKVTPDNLELFHLRRELCEKQASLCGAN